MPRPKKGGRYLNLYLDRALHEEFEQFCETLGQTKTVAAERTLRMYNVYGYYETESIADNERKEMNVHVLENERKILITRNKCNYFGFIW